MPFIESIVSQINDRILEKVSSTKAIFSIRGVSRQLPRVEDTIPAYVDDSGEGEFNAFDDDYSVCVYHKAETMTYSPEEGGTFGDKVDLQKETANMSLLCWADRSRIKVTQEALASAIASAFPYTVDKEFKKDRNISGVAIEISSVDNNSIGVWSREFQGIAYALPPESIYFQISYRIETIYDKDCLEICEEC